MAQTPIVQGLDNEILVDALEITARQRTRQAQLFPNNSEAHKHLVAEAAALTLAATSIKAGTMLATAAKR
jgi:hypothetical protein